MEYARPQLSLDYQNVIAGRPALDYTMKTLLLFFLLATATIAGAAPGIPKADSVFICTGKYAKVYHAYTGCRGLKNCKGNIIKVSLADAINKYHRWGCGWCDK